MLVLGSESNYTTCLLAIHDTHIFLSLVSSLVSNSDITGVNLFFNYSCTVLGFDHRFERYILHIFILSFYETFNTFYLW